jgi:hypothetical protein
LSGMQANSSKQVTKKTHSGTGSTAVAAVCW